MDIFNIRISYTGIFCSPSLFFFFFLLFISQPPTIPRFSLSNRLKNACRRYMHVCVCVCVLSSASYKFNLKNLVLNYALADGIFHREIDFTPVVSGFITRTPFRRILPSSKFLESFLRERLHIDIHFFETIVIERRAAARNSNQTESSSQT